MQVHQVHPNPLIQYGIMAVVIAVVLMLRMRGMSRMRPLKLEQLWIVPGLYLVLAGLMFAFSPPNTLLGWALSAAALAIGAGLGWQRGRMMHIHVDPETHALNQRTSPAALIFIVALLVVRMGLRSLAAGGSSFLHMNAMAFTDILVALALGVLATQRIEMYLRARRLLDEARAGRA